MVERNFPEANLWEIIDAINQLYPNQYSTDPIKNGDWDYSKKFLDTITFKQFGTGINNYYPEPNLKLMKERLYKKYFWNVYIDQFIDLEYSFSVNLIVPIYKMEKYDASPNLRNRDNQINTLIGLSIDNYCPSMLITISKHAPFYTTFINVENIEHKYHIRNPYKKVNTLDYYSLDDIINFENRIFDGIKAGFIQYNLQRIPNKLLFEIPPGWEHERGMDATPNIYRILFDMLGNGLVESPI